MDDRLEQEASLAPLLRAQLGLAVRTVRPGGAFVCKFFGGSHRATLAGDQDAQGCPSRSRPEDVLGKLQPANLAPELFGRGLPTVVGPERLSPPRPACQTHVCSVSAAQPILTAIAMIGTHCYPCSSAHSPTILTARCYVSAG